MIFLSKRFTPNRAHLENLSFWVVHTISGIDALQKKHILQGSGPNVL